MIITSGRRFIFVKLAQHHPIMQNLFLNSQVFFGRKLIEIQNFPFQRFFTFTVKKRPKQALKNYVDIVRQLGGKLNVNCNYVLRKSLTIREGWSKNAKILLTQFFMTPKNILHTRRLHKSKKVHITCHTRNWHDIIPKGFIILVKELPISFQKVINLVATQRTSCKLK